MPTAERAPSPSFLGALIPTGRKKCRPGTRGGREGEAGPLAPAAATPQPHPHPALTAKCARGRAVRGRLRRPGWPSSLSQGGLLALCFRGRPLLAFKLPAGVATT